MMKRVGAALLAPIILSLFLPAAAFGQAAAAATAPLGLEEILKGAAAHAPGLVAAREERDAAFLDYQASRPLGDASLGISGGAAWSTAASANAGLSLALPILPSFSLTGGLSWSDKDLAAAQAPGEGLSASAGISWNPFASAAGSWRPLASLEAAERALAEAELTAIQDAYSAAASLLKAEAALQSAREKLGIGGLVLSAVQLRFDKGQASPLELLEARAEHSELERSAYAAGNALDDAREALADIAGGEIAARLRAGASLSLPEQADADGGSAGTWTAPAFESLPETSAVLAAQASLDAARESVLSAGKGPLGLSATLSAPAAPSAMSLSLKASLDLDAALFTGREAAARDIAIAKAQRGRAQAEDAARDAYGRALRALKDADFALGDARLSVEGALTAEARARLLEASGAISEVDLRKTVQALRDARAALSAAALERERARAWFER